MAEARLNIVEKILARCKSVCKSSGRFVKSHLNYNSKNKVDTRINMDSDERNRYRLAGCSNGLVCIYDRADDGLLYVVNPSTGEVREVTFPECIDIQVLGFGYDSSIDDFKVVVGFYDHDKYSSDNVLFNVLTLKSNVWRSVAGEMAGCPLQKNGRTYGTLYNGVIHWLFDGKVIVTFDLSKEVITKIPQPAPPYDGYRLQDYWCKLGTIKDRLCIIYTKELRRTEIWVMKNYTPMKTKGIEMEDWLPPPGYDAHKPIMNYTPHGIYGHVQIWMLEKGSGAPVLVHSLESPGKNSHIKLSTKTECNYNFHLPVYVKSLKSPHAMGDDTSSSSSDHHHTVSCETLEELVLSKF